MPTYSLNRLPFHLRWHVTLVMVLTLFKPGIVTTEAIRRVRDLGDAQITQLINEGTAGVVFEHASCWQSTSPARVASFGFS